MLRKIIGIDEEKCTGCGQCVPNCPEGALQIIDGKARLVSDLFCDGLGACIGECPEGAISISEREAEPYDECKVMANVVKHGANTIKAHLEHLKFHGENKLYDQAVHFLHEKGLSVPKISAAPHAPPHGHDHEPAHEKHPAHGKAAHAHHGGACPGSKAMILDQDEEDACCAETPRKSAASRLRQWPVQIHLVPVSAPYFNGADVLIAADCVPFAYPDFHEDLLKGKVVLIGCPKLDDAEAYLEKLRNIFTSNNIKSVTVAHMEVPCCFGMARLAEQALKESGKDVPFSDVNISIKGKKL